MGQSTVKRVIKETTLDNSSMMQLTAGQMNEKFDELSKVFFGKGVAFTGVSLQSLLSHQAAVSVQGAVPPAITNSGSQPSTEPQGKPQGKT